MGIIDNYYKALTTKSQEEVELDAKIDEERSRFQNTPEFIEHDKKITELLNQSNAAFQKRLNEAKEMFPLKSRRLKTKCCDTLTPKKEDSKELLAAIDVVNNLSESDKIMLGLRCFHEDLPVDESRKVDNDTVMELHEILVQTVLDYINEKGLKDLWAVSFYADSLQSSAEYGTWCSDTDSSLSLEAINELPYITKEGKPGKIPCRVKIGESF